MELDGGSFLLLAREVNTETNENNEVLIRIFLMRVQSYIFELNLKFQFIVVVKLTCWPVINWRNLIHQILELRSVPIILKMGERIENLNKKALNNL